MPFKMKFRKTEWSLRYQTALRKYLKQGLGVSLQSAHGLGRKAVALGLEILDLAKIHKQALMNLASPGGSSGTKQRISERAKTFFTEVIVPIEKTHRAAMKDDVRINQLTQTLRRRTAESSASARYLEQGIAQRQAVEAALKNRGKQHAKLLAEAHRQQTYLRHLTHDILSVQEDKRRKSRRQLHDEIAQTLLAINLRLLTLKKAAYASTENLRKEIAKTQLFVKESVKRINKFAHEFVSPHKE